MNAGSHRIVRHAGLPGITLRVSTGSSDCYRTHTHREYSIGRVDAGEAVFTHPGSPQKVGAGTVVLIEPGVAHACNPLPDRPWSYRMLFVDADWLHGALAPHFGGDAAMAALRFPSRLLTAPSAAAEVHRLCHDIDAAQAPSPAMLAQRLVRWLSTVAEPGAPVDQPALPAALRPAWEALHGTAGQAPTVLDLARACGLHPTTFIRRFKSAVGVTPGEFLQDQRVNGARQLIASGTGLAEAAHAMGFADQAHLQRAFKARHAMTPGRFARGAAQATSSRPP